MSLDKAGYGFDNAYRLTSYNPTPITKTLPPPPATMTYDSDNRLETYNGQTVASDDNGNLQAAPVSGSVLGALGWDGRNRLLTAGGVTYTYDSENRRVSSTKNSQTTGYIWSRGGKLDRLLVKNNPDGSITRYIYGLGLIYEETTPSGGGWATPLFYHYNWQGSTVALSDASGNVTARISYSPYGERTVESGTVSTPFCFNGQFGVMTESNGLLSMQARYYSPIFRRFLSEDPSGFSGGLNTFAYTSGDPVNYIDPWGLHDVVANYYIVQGQLNLFSPSVGYAVVTKMESGAASFKNGKYDPSIPDYRNNPNFQNVKSPDGVSGPAGPIPEGLYEIQVREGLKHGQPAYRLRPISGNALVFNRGGPNGPFVIHAGNGVGCIVSGGNDTTNQYEKIVEFMSQVIPKGGTYGYLYVHRSIK